MLVLVVSSVLVAQRGQRSGTATTPPASNQAPTAAPGDDQTLSVNVDLVNILFTVADKKGKFVTNLKKEDFTVIEDGKPVPISVFEFQKLEEEDTVRTPVPAVKTDFPF